MSYVIISKNEGKKHIGVEKLTSKKRRWIPNTKRTKYVLRVGDELLPTKLNDLFLAHVPAYRLFEDVRVRSISDATVAAFLGSKLICRRSDQRTRLVEEAIVGRTTMFTSGRYR